MKPVPSLLAPRPGADPVALELFTSEGAPSPAEPPPGLIACPAPKSGPQRYRMPMWRLFDKLGD
jgi:hypothetical protein